MSKNNPKGPSGVYNYDNYGRALTPYELKNYGEISVLYEYRRLKQFSISNVALQELLKRHDSLLQIIAKKYHDRYNLTNDYEDKLQHARYAAMRAYDKFDIDKARENKFHLYNYVCNCATMYLNTANDADDFIKCPPTQRMIRSYLSGSYDSYPKKKAEIEQHLCLHNQDDKNDLRIKFSALVAEHISTDIPLENSSRADTLSDILFGSTPNNIDTQIHLTQLIECLSPIQQQIVKYVFIDGWKITDTSKLLNINIYDIRREIRNIKKIMKNISHEDLILM